MGNRLLKQQRIGRRGHPTELPVNPPVVRYKMSCALTGGRLTFRLVNQSADPVFPETGLMDIVIIKDCEVRIELDDSIEWYWPDKYAALTTKDHFAHFYKDLKFSRDGINFRFYEEEDVVKGYKHISFLAIHNVNGSRKGVNHPFSFVVNVVNTDGAMIPISIDPDIKNPPPENA